MCSHRRSHSAFYFWNHWFSILDFFDAFQLNILVNYLIFPDSIKIWFGDPMYLWLILSRNAIGKVCIKFWKILTTTSLDRIKVSSYQIRRNLRNARGSKHRGHFSRWLSNKWASLKILQCLNYWALSFM